MSNRKGADLGLTLVNLGYVAPTLTSLGGAKSTVAAGLPSFLGRNQGDPHLNLTDLKEYVLTGAAGSGLFTENYNGKSGLLTGQITTVGGGTWVNLGTTGLTCTGTAASSAVSGTDAYGAINLGAAGAQEAQIAYAAPTTGRDVAVGVRGTNTPSDGYWATLHQGVGVWTLFLRKGNYISGTQLASYAGPASSGTLRITVDASTTAPVITVYVNNVALITFTDSSAVPNGTYAKTASNAPAQTIDDFSAQSNGTLAWTVPSVGSMNWKGAWTAQAYGVNDVVSDAYALWVATTAITSSISEPVLGQSYIPTGALTDKGGSITSPISGAYNYSCLAQPFTTPGAATTVNAITLTFEPQTAGNFTVGIASALGATPSAVTWVQSVAATSPLGGGQKQFILPVAAALAANTTYYVVAVATDAQGAKAWRYVAQSSRVETTGAAVAAGLGAVRGIGAVGSAWAVDGSTILLFELGTAASTTPYWQKLTNTGNQENVGQVAASGAAVTIPDPEVQSITRVVLTANCTVTLPAVAAGKSFTVVVVQDGTGSRTLTWAGPTVLWPGGVAPTQTATASKGDVYSFIADGGGNWLGFIGGQNY